jgi:hypothetical protein
MIIQHSYAAASKLLQLLHERGHLQEPDRRGLHVLMTNHGCPSLRAIRVSTSEPKDQRENVTTTFYAITRFGMEEGTNKAIVIAVTHTNSTGKLAPLNGMILAGQVDFRPDGSRLVTLWEWENGIPLSTGNTTATEEPALINTPTTAEEAVGGAEVAE